MAAERTGFRVNMANGAPGNEPSAPSEPVVTLTASELHELVARAVAEGVRLAAGVPAEIVELMPVVAIEEPRADPELVVMDPPEDSNLAGLELVEAGAVVVLAPELPVDPLVDLQSAVDACKAESARLRTEREACKLNILELNKLVKKCENQLKQSSARKDPEAHTAKWSAELAEARACIERNRARDSELAELQSAAWSAESAAEEPLNELLEAREVERKAREMAERRRRADAALAAAVPSTLVLPAAGLLKACKDAAKATSARSNNPVLGYLELATVDGRLRITGTDGSMTIMRWVDAPGVTLATPVLVPARLVCDSLARLPGVRKLPSVELHFTPRAGYQLGRIEWDCTIKGGDRELKLACLDGDNFPRIQQYQEHRLATLSMAVLRRSLIQTVFAAVKESATGGVHYTNGVLLSFKAGRLDMVATDGHRLALKRSDGLSGCAERDLLIPAGVAGTLSKMLREDDDGVVELYHYDNCAFFRFDDLLVACGLLDVKFPDYERVIPRDIDSRVHCNRPELIDACSAVLLVVRQKDQNPVGKFETADNTLVISGDAGEIGKCEERLGCEIAGGDIRIALNPAYLIDAMKVLGGDQVTLNWISEVNPVLLTSPRDPDWTYIVMPIRLD